MPPLHTHQFNEMEIVDLFTRIIFDANTDLDDNEERVIDLLRLSDDYIETANRRDISEYLRAMGVDEMIRSVVKLKSGLDAIEGLDYESPNITPAPRITH